MNSVKTIVVVVVVRVCNQQFQRTIFLMVFDFHGIYLSNQKNTWLFRVKVWDEKSYPVTNWMITSHDISIPDPY